MKENNYKNLILDFSDIYQDEKDKRFEFIDCRDIPGTDMYCTEYAKDVLNKRLKSYPPRGIHFIDSGNYHYMTKFFVEKINTPFSLVLFDFHNDMQRPLLGNLTSCGSWARELIDSNEYLQQLILIGPEEKTIEAADIKNRKKLIGISIEDIEAKAYMPILENKFNSSYPIYISIDKDVLSEQYARTNWNQGTMSLKILEELIEGFFEHTKVIGVDVCGENSKTEPILSELNDEKINRSTDEKLYDFIERLVKGDYRYGKGENLCYDS